MDRTAEINLWTGRVPVTDGRLEEFVTDPIACMRRLHREHGDLALLRETSEKQQQLAFVFSPELNHHVLSDSKTFHSRFFTLRGSRNSAQRRLTSGLLSMNGEEHKQQRRQVSGPFEKRSIAIYHDTITTVTDQMLTGWKADSVVDMAEEMTILMRKITSMILFGMDQLDLALEIGEMLDVWVEMNHQLGLAAFLPRDGLMPEYDQMLSHAELLEGRILELMRLRREAGTLGTDLLSQLIRVHDTTGGITNEQLVGHVALLFGAGHMTSAHSLAWTTFLLAQHPEVMTSLNHELQAGIYDEPLATFDSAKGSLLDRVLRESMRVLPASSYSQRVNDVPVELGPLSLPRGTPIIFSPFVTHHRPDLYSNPDRFDPDRWLTISPTPYEYLPFGAGPRMCLGAPLAQFIIKTILPRILKHNRLTVVADSVVNGLVVSTMLSPISGIPMHLAELDDRFETSVIRGNIHTLVELPPASQQRRSAA